MFSKETYVNRRAELKKLVKSGIIILFGNNESPANFPANGYYPFRQDSTFLYYFGPKRDGLVGVIDVDNDKELLIGNDIDIDDIVWYGSVDSVHDMAEHAGVKESAPMKQLQVICDNAMKEKRTIHFLPPYRHDTMIQIFDLLGIHPSKQREAASVELIKAVVKMRSTKEQQEIEEIERACAIGYKMHTTAMRVTKPGVTEKYVGGQVNGIANSYGAMVSFPTIFSQHGEIMHGNPSMAVLESGRLALCDCGGETMEHYCSDNTRTFPVNGKFTQRQLEIYSIVEDCHDLALKISKPGVKYFDVHMDVCRLMTDRLKELGLMMGDTEEAVRAGAHAMFLPHGLGHMMGMEYTTWRDSDKPTWALTMKQDLIWSSSEQTACAWAADLKKASLLQTNRESTSSQPSSTNGALRVSTRTSSTMKSWRHTRISVESVSRTTFSSQATAAASSARSVSHIIQKTLRIS